MPRLVSFLAAEGVAIDQLTARVTAFNMIDHVLVAAIPARLVRLHALSLYELGDAFETFQERVRLLAPDGTLVSESLSQITLTIREADRLPNAHRSIHVLWSPPLPGVGDYRLMLDHRIGDGDWQTALASVCITVVLQAHPILNAQAPSVSVPAMPAADPSQPPRG